MTSYNRRILVLQSTLGALAKPESLQWGLTSEDDPEIEMYEKQRSEFTALLEKVIAERDAEEAKIDRPAAIALANRVESLKQERKNVLNALNKSIGKLSGEGIHSVG